MVPITRSVRKGNCHNRRFFCFSSISDIYDNIKRCCEIAGIVDTKAGRIPCLAEITLFMRQPELISGTPPQMKRPPDLRINTDHSFCPVQLARSILDIEGRIPFPDRVLEIRTGNVNIIGSKGIAKSDIQTIRTVLIL